MQLRGGGLKSRAPVSFGQALKELKGATTREETQTLLDVVTAAGTRFRLESGQGQVVLPSGGRQPHEAASIMLERVPAVARTRGVGVPSALEVTRYPDLRTFERELAWALWRKAAAPARPALR